MFRELRRIYVSSICDIFILTCFSIAFTLPFLYALKSSLDRLYLEGLFNSEHQLWRNVERLEHIQSPAESLVDSRCVWYLLGLLFPNSNHCHRTRSTPTNVTDSPCLRSSLMPFGSSTALLCWRGWFGEDTPAQAFATWEWGRVNTPLGEILMHRRWETIDKCLSPAVEWNILFPQAGSNMQIHLLFTLSLYGFPVPHFWP